MDNEPLIKAAWEKGFRLAVGYADNHAHFQGAQKERQWERAKEELQAAYPFGSPAGSAPLLLSLAAAQNQPKDERDAETRLDELFLQSFPTNAPAMLDYVALKFRLKRLERLAAKSAEATRELIAQEMRPGGLLYDKQGPAVVDAVAQILHAPEPLENVVAKILGRVCPQCGSRKAVHHTWCGGRPPDLEAATFATQQGRAWVFTDAAGNAINLCLCADTFTAAVIQSWGIEV